MQPPKNPEQPARKHLADALQSLRGYVASEPDPQDRASGEKLITQVAALAAKDRADSGAQPKNEFDAAKAFVAKRKAVAAGAPVKAP